MVTAKPVLVLGSCEKRYFLSVYIWKFQPPCVAKCRETSGKIFPHPQ